MKPYNEEVNENAKESMVQTLLDDYRLVVEPSWETFIHMLRWLSRPNRTFSEKHILQCILNMNSSLHVNHHRKLVFTKMNFNNTKAWDELSRKSIERIEERKRVRQANPLCIPPEYAYSAKQEDKFEHNHSRGGIRSEDDDYTTPEDVDAIQKDLFLKHYGVTMADDRRKRRGVDQMEMNCALVELMDKIYLGYANHTKERNDMERHSSSALSTISFDWKQRADEYRLVSMEKIKEVEAMCKIDLDEVRDNPLSGVVVENEKVPYGMEVSQKQYSDLETGNEPAEGEGQELYSERPNEEQEKIIDLYYRRARARINHAIDPINHPKPEGQLLTYVDCGPGAGKTWITKELFRRVNVYASRVGYPLTKTTSFFPSATTGAACVTLGHGCVTCHTGFNFGKIAKDGEELNDRLPPLSISKEVLLKARLNITSSSKSSHCAVTVDEAFMMLSIQLGHLDQRCREMTGVDADFGGLDVHLQGDCMQFDAVGENLYAGAMIDLLPWENNRPPVESPKARGRRLFRKFLRIDTLKKLPRSEGCERLKNIIDILRDRTILYPITDEILGSIKELCIQDLIDDPLFLESFITVGTNQERLALNLSHSKAYAVSKGLPLIRWRKQLKGKLAARLLVTPELKQDLYNCPEHEENLHQYFVEDISAIILTNKNTSRGIVNGADVRLFGLWFKNDSDRHEYEELRARANPGDVVTIPKPPDAVLVEISDDKAIEWESECTLVNGKHIIPLFMDHTDYSDYYVPDDGKKKLFYSQFPYDLGGVRTGYKIQGATTPRLTCNFNARPKGCRTNLNHRSFFVSISRVMSLDHFRFVPFLNNDRSSIEYMKKFTMDAKVRLLPRCYDETGKWTATTDDIIRWFDELGIAWRPKAKRGNPLSAYAMEVLRNYPKIADLKNVGQRKDKKHSILKPRSSCSSSSSSSNSSPHEANEEQRKMACAEDSCELVGDVDNREEDIFENDRLILQSVSLNSNGIMEVTPLKKRSREQQQNSLNTEASSIVCNDKKKLIKLSGRESDFHGCDMFSECPTVTPDKKRNRDDLDMEQI